MTRLDHPAFALPATVAEAVDALARRPGAAYVAGGTELMPDLAWGTATPAGLVSLRHVAELRGVAAGEDVAAAVRVGAATTIAALGAAARGSRALPGLARAAGSLGTPQVRTQATVGGNVMSALPYRNLLPVLLATRASVELTGPDGVRALPFDGFVTAPGRTRALPGELLTAVLVPPAAGYQDYVKVGPRNAQFVATASGAIAVDAAAGTVRLGFGNAAEVPLRLPAADEIATQALFAGGHATTVPAEALGELAGVVARGADPPADHVASAEYRRHALGVIAGRLLERAARARDGRWDA
jgi:CO/xanthine dehydrogenase FAD-binding subunit